MTVRRVELEPIELEAAAEGDGYVLRWDDHTVVTAFRDRPVTHPAPDLIEQMISEFGRYPVLTIEGGVIVDPQFFGAYAIYGIQMEWVEKWQDEISVDFASALARDPILTRLPGPEVNDQLARYGPLQAWLARAGVQLVDIDFVDGVNELLSDVIRVTGPYPPDAAATAAFRQLSAYMESYFRSLSPEQRTVVVFLDAIHHGALLHALALVGGECSPEEYASGVQAAHMLLARVAWDVEDEDHEQSFNDYRNDARTALAYIEAYRRGTAQGRLRDLLAAGESRDVEFKSTLRYDLQTNTKNRDLTKAIVKTIAAFMNTDGGSLLVGVADDGEIVGIDRDGFDNSDKYLLYLYQSLRNAIGDAAAAEVSHELADYGDEQVCIIKCERSEHGPVLSRFKGDPEPHLFVRTGPSTVDLAVDERDSYIRTKWR